MYFATFILKNLARRPVRTALTVLGLAVAIGSMIALLGISHNVNSSVEDLFEKRGIDLMVIAAGKTDQLASDMRQGLLEEARRVEGVADAAAALIDMQDITRESGSTLNALIQGWPANSFPFETLTLLGGRKLEAGDARKTMLGITFAENLNKSVGDTLLIHGETFEIVGIYRSFNVFENGSAIILIDEAQRLMDRPGRITGFSIRVVPNADIEAVRARIAALRDPKDPTLRLAVQTSQEYVSNQTHLKIVRAMSWMVSFIALVIGVISMLNTMVMSVLERTHEIGILRAVGWPPKRGREHGARRGDASRTAGGRGWGGGGPGGDVRLEPVAEGERLR